MSHSQTLTLVSPAIVQSPNDTTGVLLSGGLDSSILTAFLLEQGQDVQPFYVRCGLIWEPCELDAARRFLQAVRGPRLRELVVLAMPMEDVYDDLWCITGCDPPAADSQDEAVYLPGRNALLIVKVAVWCQLHGIRKLALAPLGSSPFADASRQFFDSFQAAMSVGGGEPFEIVSPFANMDKRQVMQLGRDYPLEFSFCCIAPRDRLHCGICNKCAERQAAFDRAGLADPTTYANQAETNGKRKTSPETKTLDDKKLPTGPA